MLPSLLAALQQRSNENLIAFLRVDLALGLTLTWLARTEGQMRQHESCERSAAYAERAYSEVARYLTDPKHAKRMTDEQHRKIEAEMVKLRKELDALPRSHQQ